MEAKRQCTSTTKRPPSDLLLLLGSDVLRRVLHFVVWETSRQRLVLGAERRECERECVVGWQLGLGAACFRSRKVASLRLVCRILAALVDERPECDPGHVGHALQHVRDTATEFDRATCDELIQHYRWGCDAFDPCPPQCVRLRFSGAPRTTLRMAALAMKKCRSGVGVACVNADLEEELELDWNDG